VVSRDLLEADGRYSANEDFVNKQIYSVLAGGQSNDIDQLAAFSAYFSNYLPGQPLMSYHPCC